MTGYSIERIAFDRDVVNAWSAMDARHTNWPIVYVLDNQRSVYVGESLNAGARLRQHLESATKSDLRGVRVVLDERFNKSACLDLESMLIRLFSGDGALEVLNRNDGVTDADYYDRATYQQTFDAIFDEMRAEGLFTRSIPEIENDDLFKLSPFKALNEQQAVAVEQIVEGLFADLRTGNNSTSVVSGEPGTGKTVVAVYLMKLLSDIATRTDVDDLDRDSRFSEFFLGEYGETLRGLRIGLVIPQQSLRESVKRVFKKTPGLSPKMVLSQWDVGKSAETFDLLLVDEAHRLNLRANQASAMLNTQFRDINIDLFGRDDDAFTQLDWLVAKSHHRVLMLDTRQRVRPADLPTNMLEGIVAQARGDGRSYVLHSQMRVRNADDFIGYIRGALSDAPPQARSFDGYDLRFFDDVSVMAAEIRKRDEEYGLARLAAGYAWEWITKSKSRRQEFDIEIGEARFRWNSQPRDWISSPNSLDEVGSIHTLQGYDLNYAGVIIGPDLKFDPILGRIVFDRDHYFDKFGKMNNDKLGFKWSDDDLLDYVRNIYGVLLTRGIRGTYVYVYDEALREHLRPFFTAASTN